jgi:hypothetical protein
VTPLRCKIADVAAENDCVLSGLSHSKVVRLPSVVVVVANVVSVIYSSSSISVSAVS